MFTIHSMMPCHLDGVMAIQTAAYHEIEPESQTVIARKLELSPTSCFVALNPAGQVAGYVLAHPWHYGDAPALHVYLDALPTESDSLYLHDLAIHPEWRGRHLAPELLRAVRTAAAALDCGRSHLTAIQQSAPFWEKQGYRRLAAAGHALASYPSDACLMGCRFGFRPGSGTS